MSQPLVPCRASTAERVFEARSSKQHDLGQVPQSHSRPHSHPRRLTEPTSHQRQRRSAVLLSTAHLIAGACSTRHRLDSTDQPETICMLNSRHLDHKPSPELHPATPTTTPTTLVLDTSVVLQRLLLLVCSRRRHLAWPVPAAAAAAVASRHGARGVQEPGAKEQNTVRG
jgi:hypothetical protein